MAGLLDQQAKALELVKKIAPQIKSGDDFNLELLQKYVSEGGPVDKLVDMMVARIFEGGPDSLQDKISGALGFMFVLGRIASDQVH